MAMAVEDSPWNRLNGVKALVDSGISSIPEFYVKPQEQRLSSKELCNLDAIPVIDLSELESHQGRQSVIDKLRDASETWGFFQVVNHGVDLHVMQQMLGVAHEFFELPLEEKTLHYKTDIDAPVRYGTSFNPLKEKVLDWHDHLLHRFLPEHQGPHPWPQKPLEYRKIGEEYVSQVTTLAKFLLRTLSEGLGLEAEYLEKAFGKHQAALRLNYYPPCPNPDLAIGLSHHSDVGGLTLLLQDDIPGLQVKNQGQWKTVKPIPGAFVVNICDQLQILSNGKYQSIEHRAIVNSHKARVSVALFWDPSSDVRVAPIPELLDDEHPPLYQPCIYADYIKNLYSKHLVGKSWVESQKTAE